MKDDTTVENDKDKDKDGNEKEDRNRLSSRINRVSS
jgi:hypothetical protein